MAEILEGFGGTAEQAAKAVALLKSLSHEGRLQILCCLVEGEMSVTSLAEALAFEADAGADRFADPDVLVRGSRKYRTNESP